MKYIVKFHTYWHCGSGQAAGSDVDELIIKDRDGLPYIPGRTIKGLLKDACILMTKYNRLGQDKLNEIFGYVEQSGENGQNTVKGVAHFSDAELPALDRSLLSKKEDLKAGLYDSVSSTAIGDDGIALDHSLRKIQVVVPCTLYGEIDDLPSDFGVHMQDAMKLIKRMGLGRHHGLGRCTIEPVKD